MLLISLQLLERSYRSLGGGCGLMLEIDLSSGWCKVQGCSAEQNRREEVMKMYYTVGLSMLAGIGIGAVAMQTLHAQAKPPVYVVTEIDVTNVDAYNKEYVPAVRPIIAKSGGKLVAVSQNPTSLEGAPQKSRVAINVFENLEKAKAWREGADYKEARKIGDKYAKFRAYVVEGMAQ
jgi:uncharacterized protein (DUF1330 family)